MNAKDISMAKDPAMRGSLAALQRAAVLARETAIQTNTSIVIEKDGKLVWISAEELRRQASEPNESKQKGMSMMTDTEIRVKGIQILAQYLGDIEMERFIALIQREPFDYTQWQESLEQEESVEEVSRKSNGAH